MIVFDWKNGVNQNELNIVVDMLKKDELVILPTELFMVLEQMLVQILLVKRYLKLKEGHRIIH